MDISNIHIVFRPKMTFVWRKTINDDEFNVFCDIIVTVLKLRRMLDNTTRSNRTIVKAKELVVIRL
mgnify:CR=1 FL=1